MAPGKVQPACALEWEHIRVTHRPSRRELLKETSHFIGGDQSKMEGMGIAQKSFLLGVFLDSCRLLQNWKRQVLICLYDPVYAEPGISFQRRLLE